MHSLPLAAAQLAVQYDSEPALRVFQRTVAYYGFNNFAICQFPHGMSRPVPLTVSEDWPMEWCAVHLEKGGFRHDPIVQYDRTYRPDLFHWHEAIERLSSSPEARRVIGERLENGIGHGCSVPLPLPAGAHVGVHMASNHRVELSEADRGVIVMAAHMLAGMFMDRRAGAAPELALSGPERDALIWASMGKSVPEISEEMHLPDQDTIFLLESARHKLGAANWTHAVVLALRRKLIAT